MKFKKMIMNLLLLVLMTMLCGCGKTKININDYFIYEFVGADGYGKIKFNRDEDKMLRDIATAKKLTEDESLELLIPIEDILYNNGSWDEENNLSNGDTVTFEFDLDDSVNKKIDGIEFIWSDISVKVEGLTEVEEFDPFDKLEVSIEGVSSEAVLNIKGGEYEGVSYVADKKDCINDGDIITINAEIKDMETYISKYYRIPVVTSKQYVAEGLDTYILNDEIASGDNLDAIKFAADERIKEYFVNFTDYDFVHEGLMEDADIFWTLSSYTTGDSEITNIIYGNGKLDEYNNCIYVVLKVPYEIVAVENYMSGKILDDVLGKGDAYFAITLENNVITSQGLVVGKVGDLNVKNNAEELIKSANSLKKDYEISEVSGKFNNILKEENTEKIDININYVSSTLDTSEEDWPTVYTEFEYLLNNVNKGTFTLTDQFDHLENFKYEDEIYNEFYYELADIDDDGLEEIIVNLTGDTYVIQNGNVNHNGEGYKDGRVHVLEIEDNRIIEKCTYYGRGTRNQGIALDNNNLYIRLCGFDELVEAFGEWTSFENRMSYWQVMVEKNILNSDICVAIDEFSKDVIWH